MYVSVTIALSGTPFTLHLQLKEVRKKKAKIRFKQGVFQVIMEQEQAGFSVAARAIKAKADAQRLETVEKQLETHEKNARSTSEVIMEEPEVRHGRRYIITNEHESDWPPPDY